MDKQWIDTEQSPLELTLNTALYGGDGLASSLPGQIMPDVELYVAVTVHDIKGNVHLDNLNTAMVTPIDNIADTTPPDRLTDINLYDRPADDGTAMLLEFALSQDSDVAYYEVYAAAFSFTSVGATGTVNTPIVTLERDAKLPLLIGILAFDALVVPNTPVTVAVVPVDWSGNAYRDNLVTSTAIAIDDGVDDVGSYLPDIEGINLQWVEDSIVVSWDHSTDPAVRSYVVFISDSEFSSISDATNVGMVSTSNSFVITPETYSALSNESSWWVGVAAKDDLNSREIIDSEKIVPIDSSDGNGDSGSDGDDSSIAASLDIGFFSINVSSFSSPSFDILVFILFPPRLLDFFFVLASDLYTSLKSTNSIIAIEALSPNRLPSLMTLVYPPGRSPTFIAISLNNSATAVLSLNEEKANLLLCVVSSLDFVITGSINCLRAFALVRVVLIRLCSMREQDILANIELL